MFDAIVSSDWHLGSPLCLHRRLAKFVGALPLTNLLVINGDLLEDPFGPLSLEDWFILNMLSGLAKRTEVLWVRGNHDEEAELIAHALGIKMVEECDFISGGKRFLCLHGDRFDDFLLKHPFLSSLGDWIYSFLQRADKTHRLAIAAKHASKEFLDCTLKVREGAGQEAWAEGYHAVICGHTHHAEARLGEHCDYYNTGCWTELPGTYLTVKDGIVELKTFEG